MDSESTEGTSPLRSVYRNVWYAGVLRRYNEAIALNYVIPLRTDIAFNTSGFKNSNGKPTDLTRVVRAARRQGR